MHCYDKSSYHACSHLLNYNTYNNNIAMILYSNFHHPSETLDTIFENFVENSLIL